MRNNKRLLILCLCLLPFMSGAQTEDMRLGMYVVVSDLQSAKAFYQDLFGSEPTIENEAFVGFSVSGSLFGLFVESAFTHELTRGNNAVPYIQVNDIQQAFARVQALGAELVHEKVLAEGPLHLFMFKDPDGNALEFFALSTTSN